MTVVLNLNNPLDKEIYELATEEKTTKLTCLYYNSNEKFQDEQDNDCPSSVMTQTGDVKICKHFMPDSSACTCNLALFMSDYVKLEAKIQKKRAEEFHAQLADKGLTSTRALRILVEANKFLLADTARINELIGDGALDDRSYRPFDPKPNRLLENTVSQHNIHHSSPRNLQLSTDEDVEVKNKPLKLSKNMRVIDISNDEEDLLKESEVQLDDFMVPCDNRNIMISKLTRGSKPPIKIILPSAQVVHGSKRVDELLHDSDIKGETFSMIDDDWIDRFVEGMHSMPSEMILSEEDCKRVEEINDDIKSLLKGNENLTIIANEKVILEPTYKPVKVDIADKDEDKTIPGGYKGGTFTRTSPPYTNSTKPS